MPLTLSIQAHREILLEQLAGVEAMAKASRFSRMTQRPMKYIQLWQSRLGKSRITNTHLFFGPTFRLALPAAADLFLCGGKTHDSEIRLARFLIRYLPEDAQVLDIGAHYGYFTLLMAHVANKGKVWAIEAAPASAVFLLHNTQTNARVRCFKMGLGEQRGTMPFYTFPPQYSEYNTLDVAPYAGQAWFVKNPPEVHQIPIDTLDGFCAQHAPEVQWIKMDVEGAEARILQGASAVLQTPRIWMMEYLSTGNTASYERAEKLFLDADYRAYAITDSGDLKPLTNVLAWMKEAGLESENIVFMR